MTHSHHHNAHHVVSNGSRVPEHLGKDALSTELSVESPVDHRTKAARAVVYERRLPPVSDRIIQAHLKKQVITAKGIKWFKHFTVLSQDHLAFAKPMDGSPDAHWIRSLGCQVTTNTLWEVFTKHDLDENGSLDFEETVQALSDLHMFSTEEDCRQMFAELDSDGNGVLDWEEFKAIAQRAAVYNTIVDYIPLVEIVRVDFEIKPREDRNEILPSHTSKQDSTRDKKPSQKPSMSRLVHAIENYIGIQYQVKI